MHCAIGHIGSQEDRGLKWSLELEILQLPTFQWGHCLYQFPCRNIGSSDIPYLTTVEHLCWPDILVLYSRQLHPYILLQTPIASLQRTVYSQQICRYCRLHSRKQLRQYFVQLWYFVSIIIFCFRCLFFFPCAFRFFKWYLFFFPSVQMFLFFLQKRVFFCSAYIHLLSLLQCTMT